MTIQTTFYLVSALLPTGWAQNVKVIVDAAGDIHSVESDVVEQSTSGLQISNPVIPGIPNCHSHAHQRAMAGLGEKATLDASGSSKAEDSFWTWRKVMYSYLERIEPEHLRHISKLLYLEMLKSGFTNVAEFQYLHHDLDGKPYANRAEMTLQCMASAAEVGIGFTALPVLYRFGGFGEQQALPGQRRFLNNQDEFSELVGRLFESKKSHSNNMVSVGIAPHSLRAVSEPLLNGVLNDLQGHDLAAVHVHVSEQTKEVDDCVSWSGQRPVEWMLNHFEVNHKWCPIHATHMDETETQRLAASGAVAGLCPTTEGNLGDGFFNMDSYQSANGRWAIGSDSHISISPTEELRWLEYGQRLLHRKRNLAADTRELSTGSALLAQALSGGRQSSGLNIGRIEPGARADFLVLDAEHPRLAGRSDNDLIDSWIFSGNENPILDVYVAGKRVIESGHHADETVIQDNYLNTIAYLSGATS